MSTAKSEITLKFSELPTATPAANKKVEVLLTDQNGIVFTALINAKSWRKAETDVAAFAEWGGSISGKLGARTEQGFEIVEAGIKVFEKRLKEAQGTADAVNSEAVPVG